MAQKRKKRNRSCPTSSEAAILRAIWQLSELQRRTPTIAEIQRELRTDGHVVARLREMARKGYVRRVFVHRVELGYCAVWTLDRCLRAAVLQIADDYQTTFYSLRDVVDVLDGPR